MKKVNYPTKKLGEVCDVQAGFGFSKELQGKKVGDYPFFKVGDMNTDIDNSVLFKANHYLDKKEVKDNGYKIFPVGTIIFPKIGGAIATNKKRILGVEGIYDNNVMGLIPSPRISSAYLFHWMKLQDISQWSSGTSLPAIKKSFVEQLEIPLPPLEVQKKIVAKLENLLAKVSKAKKLRAEARESADNLLSAELHKIFEEGKNKGWEEKELGEISEIARGGSPRPINAYFTEDPNGINWIKIGDATRSNKYIYETKQKIKPEGLKKSRQVNEGDLLLSNSMSFGRPYIMKTTGAIHDGWLVIKPDHKKVSEEYLYQVFGAPQVISFVENLAGGAVVKNLNINRVKTIPIPLPPLTEQKKIVARLDSISQKIEAVKELQNTTENEFDALESSVLSKAFSGNLAF